MRKYEYWQVYGDEIKLFKEASKNKKRKRNYTNIGTPSTDEIDQSEYDPPETTSTPIKKFPNFDTYFTRCKSDNKLLKEQFSKKQITTFLNMSLLMTTSKVSNVWGFWTTSGLDSALCGKGIFRYYISRSLFIKIKQNLTCDPEFLERRVNENSRNLWNCFKELSVDEIIAPFKGKVRFKQYLPLKPHKFGLKYYALSDLVGYIFAFWLYKGKESTHEHKSDRIVLDLLDHIDNPNNHILGVDNFYGSLNLANELSRKQWNYVMTVKGNRPTFLFNEGLQKRLRGKNTKEWVHAVHKKNSIAAICINDNKKVNFLTNLGSNQTIQSQPLVQKHYNNSMGCVDKSGIYLHKMDSPFKVNNWKIIHLFELLRISVVNQFLIYKTIKKQPKLTLYNYLKVAAITNCEFSNPHYNRTMHFPVNSPTRHLCEHCKNGHSLASYRCPGCSASLHFQCFVKYHLKKHIYY